MRAHEVTFLELVGGEKQFQVPLYQRTYSWGATQLEQLWRDIVEHSENDGADSSSQGHFLGSVVLAPSPSLQAAGMQRWLVVDGQQRLTTLMLALAAIRDHVAGEGNAKEEDRIHRQYLVNEFQSGDERLRVLPTQADREAYGAIVLRSASSSTAGNVGDAYSFFRSGLEGLADSEDVSGALAIEATIRTGLSIVEITAERGDNVYRIFESLNNTGLQLSQADLLRNYLFMKLPTRGEDVYRDVWLPMQAQLSSRELELLVWLDLVIRGEERAKQSEIYRAQQGRLERLPDGEAVIEAEIQELARRSRHLKRLLDPSVEHDSRLREALERLKDWGATTAYPLVMHLLDLEERGVTQTADVVEALTFVESFLVRRMLCQVPTNNLNRVFNGAPSAIGEVADVAEAVRTYLSGRRRYWPTDAELRRNMRTRPFYWTGRVGQRIFVLRRMEESYGSAEPVDFDRAELTIEHVLPQTPTGEWLDLLAADVTDEGGPKELHDLLVHTVGNLTLTGENARLSNRPFQRKQDIYQVSALRMNKEIAETESWGKAQIVARSDRLAERAVSLWPGPIDGVGLDDEGRDWTLLRRACAVLNPGMWTSYADLAELIGSHPVPVGRYLATQHVQNAWRVLMSDGSISPGFSWGEHDRTGHPKEVLESEGVLFNADRADGAQRVTAAELAALLGMEIDDVPDVESADITVDSPRGQRFLSLLTEAHPDCVAAVRDLLHNWQMAGGHLAWGRASETSCFLMISVGSYEPLETSSLIIYPTAGSMEVTFQYMRSRPVFDDIARRDEFRRRLELAGSPIPEAKLSLRPSLSVEILREDDARDAVKNALDWFALTFQTTIAQDGAR